MTTINYNNYVECSITCFSVEGKKIESGNLIEELAYNISTTTLLKLSQIASSFKSQLNNTYFDNDTFSTEFQEIDNITNYYNRTYGYDDFSNVSLENIHKLNITELTFSFIDYLTFILHDFVGDNETMLIDSFDNPTFSPTTDISTPELSTTNFPTTNFPITDFSSVEEFNVFKSTITPLITKITETTEFVDTSRFDYDLQTLYGDISSTAVTTLKENCTKICENIKIPSKRNVTSVAAYDPEQNLNYTMKARLRTLCWETMFGQELIRLTVMDLVMTVGSTLAMDFLRGLFVRVMNR